MRRFVFGLTMMLAVLVMASGAQAGWIGNVIGDGRLHTLNDSNADLGITLNESTGNYEIATGAIEEGDFLWAGVNFAAIDPVPGDSAGLDGQGANGQLGIKLAADPVDEFTNAEGVQIATFPKFVAPTVAEWNKIIDDVFGGNPLLKKTQEGTLGLIYDNADVDFQRTAIVAGETLKTSVDRIADGTAGPVLELGWTGEADANGNIQDDDDGEGWAATGPTVPGGGVLFPIAQGISGTSVAGTVNVLINNTGLAGFLPLNSPFDVDGTAQFVLTSNLFYYGDGTGTNTPAGPWQLGTETDVSFRPVIPEPASVAMWSLLIAGGFALTRRRKK
jgi:hypothetical protein